MKNEPTYSLLNAINYPKDLRQLSVDQLPEVCEELRQDIIKEQPGALRCQPRCGRTDCSTALCVQHSL